MNVPQPGVKAWLRYVHFNIREFVFWLVYAGVFYHQEKVTLRSKPIVNQLNQ